MILDTSLLFSDAQAITATAASTNAIDFLATGTVPRESAALPRNVARAVNIPLLIQVVETFDTAAEDGTLTIDLELDSTDTFTPDKTIRIANAIPEASLVAGYQVPFDYLPDGIDLRFAQLKYTVGGAGNFTAGKITAGIVAAIQKNG